MPFQSSDEESDHEEHNTEWTADEQAIVFKKYGLDTMFPKQWKEDLADFDPALDLGSRTDVTDVQIVPETSVDASDPLGLRESAQAPRRQKTRRNQWQQEATGDTFITSKNFDAKAFLLSGHKQTSYKELESGVSHLKKVIEQRADTLKGQVKKHFAKFVNAKVTIDSFYKEMRSRNLISSQEYGIAPFSKALDELEARADRLYGPILERRGKADKIRVALSILEQWRFFFNLPSSLIDMIKKGRFDGAVRDYKKGKNLMLTSFRKEHIKDKSDKKEKDAQLLPTNYKGVFEKVWTEVEEIVAQLREELFRQLGTMSNPIETQEKIITYLIDLDSKRDPLSNYLETQYLWLLEKLTNSFNEHMKFVNALPDYLADSIKVEDLSHSQFSLDESLASKEHLPESDSQGLSAPFGSSVALVDISRSNAPWVQQHRLKPSNPWNLQDIAKATAALSTSAFDAHFGREINCTYWQSVLHFTETMCELVNVHVVAFWKTCKLYVDGRLQKIKQGDPRADSGKRAADVQIMLKNVFELIKVINNLLIPVKDLSDDAETPYSFQNFDEEYKEEHSVAKEDSGMTQADLMQIVHDYIEKLETNHENGSAFMKSHPLIVCNYAVPIVNKITKCLTTILPNFLSEENLVNEITQAFDSVREHLLEVICAGWVNVANTMHHHETWSFSSTTHPSGEHTQADATVATKLYTQMGIVLVRSLHLVSGGHEIEEIQITQKFVDRIRNAFYDSQNAILDGFQYLVTKWRDPDYTPHDPDNFSWCPPIVHKPLRSHQPSHQDRVSIFVPMEIVLQEEAKQLSLWEWETRSFVIMTNITYTRDVMIPKLCNAFESKFRVPTATIKSIATDISAHLHHMLLLNYTKRQSEKIAVLVREGILFSGIDWGTLVKPQEIRQHIYHILLNLVLVHAAINEISKSLVRPILEELVQQLGQELLLTFRSVDKFSTGGMLQATLEIDFLSITLEAYQTEESLLLFNQIHEEIEKATDLPTEDDTKMNELLGQVKVYLARAQKTTGVQFLCFKETTNQ
ncbi:exocyst complex component Sec5-domain-containing protein [Gorgonomyces haynaldii]|nr:exocyst complex component Sec5-domain-containing protein [Gorgonomyces haynaldii]